MNLQRQITASMSRSVSHVFSTMLGVEMPPGEASVEPSTPDANDGVVSFIGVAGPWTGTGSVICSPILACRICNHMLMTDTTAVDEEVLDAVGELTNMIIGNVTTDLEQHLGPLGLSIPTVVFGRNFRTRSASSMEWIVMRFPWEGDTLLVKMCLVPHGKAAHGLPHGASHACAPEV